MVQAPSLAVTNFGTEEPAPPAPILSAGNFTAEFDAGNLRHIRFGGVEVMRAISFIVRDKNWGTYNPRITNLKIEQSPAGFTVSYDALTERGKSSAITPVLTEMPAAGSTFVRRAKRRRISSPIAPVLWFYILFLVLQDIP